MGGASSKKADHQKPSVLLSSDIKEQAGSKAHSSQAAVFEDRNEEISGVSQEGQAEAARVVAPEAGQTPAAPTDAPEADNPIAVPRQGRLFPAPRKRRFRWLQVC